MQPAQTSLDVNSNHTWVTRGLCARRQTQTVSTLYISDMCRPSTYAINDLALTGQTDCLPLGAM